MFSQPPRLQSDEDRSMREPPMAAPIDGSAHSVTALNAGNEQAEGRARLSRWWLIFGFLVLLQYGLFRQYVQRELAWSYPTNFDQVTYLNLSYQIYEQIVQQGIVAGLLFAFGMHIPNGVMLQTQAALLYLVLGPSRLSALTLNFAYFALMQWASIATLRWLSRSWSIAFLGLGMLLSATTTFNISGGLLDFRIDFIAFCLLGILTCAIVRSNLFQSWRWSILVGLIGALTVWFRFVTLTYIGGTFALTFLFLCFRFLRERKRHDERSKMTQRHIVGIVLAGLTILLLSLPILIWNFQIISFYYGSHFGDEGPIRARELGIFNRLDALSYYPKQILDAHYGVLLLAITIVALGAVALKRFERNMPRNQLSSLPINVSLAYVYLLAGVIAPLVILTINTLKSPIVGNVTIPALLWLVLLTVTYALRGTRTKSLAPQSSSRLISGIALLALISGLGYQIHVLSRHGMLALNRPDVEQVLALHTLIGQQSRQLNLSAPRISTDVITDYLYPGVLKTIEYEKSGHIIDPQARLGAINIALPALALGEALKQIDDSDFVILTDASFDVQSPYPFTQSMVTLRPALRAHTAQHFVMLRQFHFFGRDATLYARPTVTLSGDSGGWITSDGMILSGTTFLLRQRPIIELRGEDDFHYLNPPPVPQASVLVGDAPPEAARTTLTRDGNRYRLVVELSPQILASDAPVRVNITFDRYWVPKALNINPDERQLVIRTPTQVTLLAQK